MNNGLLGIARSALQAHQATLQVVSQNIANAETPGYSRQRPQLAANDSVQLGAGYFGTGVSLVGIERVRSESLDVAFRSANALLGESTARRDLLTQVEDIFGEPSESGLAATLDQFWTAFGDLAASPASASSKALVQQRGRQLAQRLNEADTRLTQVRTQATDRLQATVGEINQLATRVADLNVRIPSAEAGGATASELRDQRDLLLDRLSRLAGTRAEPMRDGSVTVLIGNSTLVEGATARPLALALDPPSPPPAVPTPDVPVRVQLGDRIERLGPLAGELGAAVSVVNADLPTLRSRLDTLAGTLATTVNSLHTGGFLFPGGTVPGVAAGAFFDPGSVGNPVRAGTITLAAAVAADPAAIAGSRDAMAPLDNALARDLAALRNDTSAITWTSPAGQTETAGFTTFHRATLTRIGFDVRTAADDAEVRTALVDQSDTRRQSVSGVSVDEELVQLMRVQQSYAAASKIVRAADEMLQIVLGLI
jgi:flagellar hook-associated protein 1 FlgK